MSTEQLRANTFLDLEKAKGMKYSPPRMPVDAIDTNMRLLVLVDAA